MKHAYLIMAHGQYEQLEILIGLLDHPDHDLYIHIDAKSGMPKGRMTGQYSNVYLMQEVSVFWGTYSMVECTFRLIERAIQTKDYDYFHLISGQDLPLKSANEIAAFFEDKKGYEFVNFSNDALEGNTEIARRAKLYHLFTKQRVSHKQQWINRCFIFLDRVIIAIQMCLGIDRNKKDAYKIGCGANWFSITFGLAKAFLDEEERIRDRFKFTNNCDELALQSFMENSSFKDRCYGQAPNYENLRYVNWKRQGVKHPEVMTAEDVKRAQGTNALFARKFDIRLNREAVEYLLFTMKAKR